MKSTYPAKNLGRHTHRSLMHRLSVDDGRQEHQKQQQISESLRHGRRLRMLGEPCTTHGSGQSSVQGFSAHITAMIMQHVFVLARQLHLENHMPHSGQAICQNRSLSKTSRFGRLQHQSSNAFAQTSALRSFVHMAL